MRDEARETAAVDTGFPPIAGNAPAVLVLGSLPGKKSIVEQQYYAHPQNAFWKIMGALFEARTELLYEERVSVLKKNRIALWDVLQSSSRPGSLDPRAECKLQRLRKLPARAFRHSSYLFQRQKGGRSVCATGGPRGVAAVS
jgi:hypoxanthine-DNA glycosylase